MKKEKPKIACLPNGPYYLLNDMMPKAIPNIQTSKGGPCSTIAGVALCRCGSSNNKPFWDGTHGKSGFTDEKLTDGSLHALSVRWIEKQAILRWNPLVHWVQRREELMHSRAIRMQFAASNLDDQTIAPGAA